MSILANQNPADGGSYRHAAAEIVAVAAGCLLFAASRKLVWGREESLAEVGLWALAILPYAGYFFVMKFAPSSRAAVESADFLAIWTSSLLAFVLLRITSLSKFYENSIYDTFGPGTLRYLVLFAIYIGLGFVAVVAWRFLRTRFDSLGGVLIQRLVSFFLGVALFLSGIFLIAL